MGFVDTYWYTGANVALLLSEALFYRWFGWQASFVFLVLATALLGGLDWYTSPSAAINRRVLLSNGYTDGMILATMAFNAVVTAIAGTGFLFEVVFDVHSATPHWDAALVVHVVVALAVTEVMFTVGHMAMHLSKAMAPFHVMHHCCIAPSWSTNFIFHPVDLMIEFTAPILAIVALHYVMFAQDGFGSCVALTVMFTWYALDHDANVRLPHTVKHHGWIDSTYTIYVDVKTADPKDDCVKPLVKKD